MSVKTHKRYGAAVPAEESGVDHINWNGWKADHPWGRFEIHLFSVAPNEGHALWFIPGGKGEYHQVLTKNRLSAQECMNVAAFWVGQKLEEMS